MLPKRIIACLDVKDGRVVKGVNFVDFKDAGDPAELARYYCEQGADEIVFLDITATHENRDTVADLVKRTACRVSVPLCVGGGIRSIEDFDKLLDAGADKISINSAAVRNKTLIARAAEKFGSQRVVVAIDAKAGSGGGYDVYINGGRVNTGIDAVSWAIEVEKLGAGEILLTSMDADGTKAGFDVQMVRAVTDAVKIPCTASGGGGSLEHFAEVFEKGHAGAALAASLFHFGELTVKEIKDYLEGRGITVL